ncbi:MAG: AsmA family protein [Ramlibacter sp.]
MTAAAVSARRIPWWAKLLIGLAALAVALVLLVALFPWDTLRGPVNRYVSNKTGRHFEITRRLDVKVGRTTRVLMDGIEFGNPDWAQDRELVKADAAEIDVRLLPLLLHRQLVLPLVKLTRPQLGLQMEPDGRRTWALSSDTKDHRSVPQIGAFVVDQGTAHFIAREHGADVRAEFAINRQAPSAGAGAAMPLQFKASGRWQDQPFSADGRTGDVLVLNAPLQHPFPAEVHATAGATSLRARGSVATLASLDGLNIDFQLQGEDLAQLYKLIGVVLPNTPRYAVAGQLSRQGDTWRVRSIDGRLGRSDIAGELAFDRAGSRPALTGQLRSRMLDFEDLAPLIGMKDKPGAKPRTGQATAVAAADDKRKQVPRDPNRKVLPNAPLDVSRLRSMDADVRVDASRIVNAKGLPLDRMGVHVHLKDGLLVLDPLDVGFAGGQVAGSVRVNSATRPVQAQARLDARSLDLQRLLPTTALRRESIGKLQGQLDLAATGTSVAQLLGSSSGNIAMLVGNGQISNILLEFAGLDAGEILKFLVKGDQTVRLRCAAAAFSVDKGLMTSRALVLDTNDTVFYGDGHINLADESMDLTFHPYPKDHSILALRSPLKLTGTFGAPKASPDKGTLASRAALALGLGAINPLLGLASTYETGPGRDADCAGTLKQAGASRAEARVQQTAPPPPTVAGGKSVGDKDDRGMGAGPAPGKAQGPAAGAAAAASRPALTQGTPATPNAP